MNIYEEIFQDIKSEPIAPQKLFTIEGQLGNRISNTTRQDIKHNLFPIEVTILGWNDNDKSHSVWVKSLGRSKRYFEYLSLEEAINEANNLILNF